MKFAGRFRDKFGSRYSQRFGYRRTGGGALDTLVFKNDLTLGSLTSERGPALSFTRATASTTEDFEGLIRTILSGEARFHKLRRVRQLISNSGTLTAGGGWTLTNVTSVVGATDPDGGTTAYTVTATAGNGSLDSNSILATVATHSIYIKRRTGSGSIDLWNGSAYVTGLAVTTSWQRFSVTNAAAGTAQLSLRIATNGDAVDVWHPQIEDIRGQAITAPSEYVSKGVLSSPYHGAGVDGVKYFTTANGNTVV